MGSPAIPKLGTIGTQQDSRCYLALFACRMASGWHQTGDGAVLVPLGSWVFALWSLFGNVWTDLPFLVSNSNLEHPRQGFQPFALIDE